MNPIAWSHVIAGALILGYAVAGLFFLRFWVRTRDRLFALFALAFWALMIERLLLVGLGASKEVVPFIYTVRLTAFLLIIGAIIDKNGRQSS